jgi:hypothetical protein
MNGYGNIDISGAAPNADSFMQALSQYSRPAAPTVPGAYKPLYPNALGVGNNVATQVANAGTGGAAKPAGAWWNPFSWNDEQKLDMWGGKDADGNMINGTLTSMAAVGKGLADSWLGMQQLDLGQEQLAFQKNAFNQNFQNQRTLTNASLQDRQAARVAANPNGYQSVGDYMKENGV